jgi:hypothetical protein
MVFSQCMSEKAKDLTTDYIKFMVEEKRWYPKDPLRYLRSTLFHIFEYDLTDYNIYKNKKSDEKYDDLLEFSKKKFKEKFDDYYKQCNDKAINKFKEKNPNGDPEEDMAALLILMATNSYLVKVLEKDEKILQEFEKKLSKKA